MDLETIIFILLATGDQLINFDENKTGADDFAGELLVFGAETIAAVKNGEEIPPLPEIIAKGTTEKLSSAGKLTLRIASTFLLYAQTKFTGKLAVVFRYLNQAIRSLLNGSTIPPAPAF